MAHLLQLRPAKRNLLFGMYLRINKPTIQQDNIFLLHIIEYSTSIQSNTSPNNRVVVFPAAIIASRVWPTVGNFVQTTLWTPILPKVYTFDSPISKKILYYNLSIFFMTCTLYIFAHTYNINTTILYLRRDFFPNQ